ncbi:MAG: YigZ family protein [Betaproteobacteria bacterium HGW-Betaproteobacteria-2]|nr:MAG: YigZ family protein [Betaproteobacteria bacterium HGW-Betaproteobacteria-2]
MQTIQQSGLAEQTLNKSRFVAFAAHCANEREVVQMLRKLASEHPHAHHLAFAFQLKTPDGLVQRMNDAGEPSGTAGRPILQHIEGQKLLNVCVGVIRYYGGINLGTGGLARAYGGTAKLALDATRRVPFVEMGEVRLEMDYASFDSFSRELEKINGRILDKQFDANVTVLASVPAKDIEALQGKYQLRKAG